MLGGMNTSTIKYLCFGCEKCKDTEDELFVYICPSYNKVYLGTKKEGVRYFYITDFNKTSSLHYSCFTSVENVPKDNNMAPGRIVSLTELMERIKVCG